MKKNLVSFRQQDFYKHYFLPMIEVILTVKMIKSQDLVINKTTLADYFEIDRHDVANFLKQAEVDGLIKFDKNVRKFDDTTLEFAISRYILPTASDDSKYYSKLQEHINNYMDWTPDFGDRLDFYYDYVTKFEDSSKSISKLAKEEKAKAYLEQNLWTKEMMNKINTTRPELLKSTYLADGKLRESNRLCATLNPEKEHEMRLLATDLNYRYNVLTDFFRTNKFIEADTNGSIYRLSYNLNHDELLSHDVDIYAEFWKLAGFKIKMTKTFREHLKVLCMPIFMSNGAKNGYNALLTLKDDVQLTKSEHNRKLVLNQLSEALHLDARTILDRLTEAMYKFIGTDQFLEAEIFIHESNLHLLILNYCLEHNIQTINVYDGFYFKATDMTNDKYHDIYDLCTAELKKLQ